jgi:hypothetical protein
MLREMAYKQPKTTPFFQEVPHFRQDGRHVPSSAVLSVRRLDGRSSNDSVRCPTILLVRSFCLTPTGMNTLTVTAKGQITLRKEPVRPTGKISDVFDIFKKSNRKPLSIEQINEIARRGWAGRR